MRVGNTSTSGTLNIQHQVGINQSNLAKSLERLSSGMRINKAADDAAGLAVSETIRTQIRGLAQASANSEDGLNLLNTADGGLQEMQNMLNRVRELVIEGANETYTDDDRIKIQGEIAQLLNHVDEVSNNTEFNGIKVLRGGTAVKGGALGYITVPVLTPTVPGTPGSPTVPMVPTVPAVIIPMVPTVESSAAYLYRTIGTSSSTPIITPFSLGGLAVDPNGNIYVGGSEQASSALPPSIPHAIIKIDSAGVVDPDWTQTSTETVAGVAVDQVTGDLYITANDGAVASIQRIPAGSPPGTPATTIVTVPDPFAIPAIRTVFTSGIAINPANGTVNFGTASPLYDTNIGGLAPSRMNNIFQVNGPQAIQGLLGDAGVPIPPGAISGTLTNGVPTNAGLHTDRSYPNNNHEINDLPNGDVGGAHTDGNNLFLQDLTFDSTGNVYFTSRMTAPLEFTRTGGAPDSSNSPAPADGKLFVATPLPGNMGSTIKQIDLSSIPITSGPVPSILPPVRFGGMAIEPVSGDLFVADRDNGVIWRITDPGSGTETASIITVGGNAVVGVSFVQNPANPEYGRLYLSTITGDNEVWTLDPDIPMVPTIIVTPTVPMVPTIPMGVATPTIPAVFGPAEFVALDGSLQIQSGANEAQTVRIRVSDMSAHGLNLEGMDITKWGSNPYGSASTDQYVEDVNYDIKRIDDALANISTVRATFGAYYNRLEHARSNVDNAKEQQSASESRIRDTDMAQEASEMVRQQILSQASTAMLSQINSVNSQLVMGLIKGVNG